jgi:DNA repair protein RadC
MKNNNAGHRKRVKETFLSNYNKNLELQDQDILEMLLFYSIPRKDVKPIAKELLKEFGSLNSIIHTNPQYLKQINGITDHSVVLFNIIKITTKNMLKKEISHTPVLDNWQGLLDYCYTNLAHEKKEYIKILYLNTKSTLIKEEILQEGTINYSTLYPREVVKKALEFGASAFILAHNHPSGDLRPSAEDIAVTNKLAKIASSLEIILHDHIIVSNQGIVSFKQLGLL